MTEEELEFRFHIDPGFSGLPRRASSSKLPGLPRKDLESDCRMCQMCDAKSVIHSYLFIVQRPVLIQCEINLMMFCDLGKKCLEKSKRIP